MNTGKALQETENAMEQLRTDFQTAVENLNLAAVCLNAFYYGLTNCRTAFNSRLSEVTGAFDADSSAKDRKHAEQKQKLDGIVSDAEMQLKEAQKALSVAFTSGTEQQQEEAKKALSDAQTDLDQAQAARAVFDEAVGVQYDETLYNQIFETETTLLEVWEKLQGWKKQVDETAAETLEALRKAKESAKYLDFSGLTASKQEAIKARFNHAGTH